MIVHIPKGLCIFLLGYVLLFCSGHSHADDTDITPKTPAAVQKSFVSSVSKDPIAEAWQRLAYISENIYEWGGTASSETAECIAALEEIRMEGLRVAALVKKGEEFETFLDPCGEVACEIMTGLLDLGDPSALEYAIPHLIDSTFGGGSTYDDRLLKLGPVSVPHLIPYLDNEDSSRLWYVITLLGRIGERYREGLGGIVEYIILPKLKRLVAEADAGVLEGVNAVFKRNTERVIIRLEITDETKIPPDIAAFLKLPDDIDPDDIPTFSIQHSERVWYIYNRWLNWWERDRFNTLKMDPKHQHLPPAVIKALAISQARQKEADKYPLGSNFNHLRWGAYSLEDIYRQIDDFYEIIRFPAYALDPSEAHYYTENTNLTPEAISKYGALISEYEKDLAIHKVMQKAYEAEISTYEVESYWALKRSQNYQADMASNELDHDKGVISSEAYIAKKLDLALMKLDIKADNKRLEELYSSIDRRYTTHRKTGSLLRARASIVENARKTLETHLSTE